jgi:hypothetical protein
MSHRALISASLQVATLRSALMMLSTLSMARE